MKSEVVKFTGSAGSELSGRLDTPPDGKPIACALFAHCFTCSKDLRSAIGISRALTLQRIAVFRFDFTGLGQSEGDFSETVFSTNVEDLIAAGEALKERGMQADLLVGHSLGGAAVIRAAGRMPETRMVATIGAPFDPAHVANLFKESSEEILRDGAATVDIAGRPFKIRRELLEDLNAQQLEADLKQLDRPLLVCHAPLDQTVGIGNAADIFLAARHPKSFLSLDHADHLLSNPEDARYVGTMLGAWASRYLPSPPAADSVEGLIAEQQVATRTAADSFHTLVRAAGHGLVADEPVAVGGGDEGPSPYDLLLAGLGACTGMTLRMYADRKGWPLEEVEVQMRHGKVHAVDEAGVEEGSPRMDQVDRKVKLYGDLSAEQKSRLIEIADRCPVHRTLTEGSTIITEAAD